MRDSVDQSACDVENLVERRGRLALAELEPLLGFQLRMSNVVLHRDFSQATERYGLTQKQTGVMFLVGDNPGVSQVDLAATLLTDRATMMGVVDRLEKRGLLVRKRSVDDRRRQELYLSDEGECLRGELHVVILEHEKRFAERFSKNELGLLMNFLRRIHTR